MDFRQRIKEHQALVQQVSEMQARLERERESKLANLPTDFGFPDLASFISALREAAGEKKPTVKPVKSAPPVDQPRKKPQTPPSAPAPSQSSPTAASPVKVTIPVPAAPLGSGIAAAAKIAIATPSAQVTAPAPETPKPSGAPTGTSLDDPTNFGLLPDSAVLDRGELTIMSYRERLAEALRFASRVLHTSKVPAAIWREWRQFERRLTETLAQTQG